MSIRTKTIAIGVDLGGTNLRAVAINADGQIIERITYPTQAQEGPNVVIKNIVASVRTLLAKIALEDIKIIGVGIGAPGPLNSETGVVIKAPNLPGWENIHLRDIVAKELQLPVRIENDANVAAFAEYWKGAGQNSKVMICLTLGTGVGGGIIIDGNIFRGSHFIGAELGHITIKYDGLRCSCGNKGCLEAYVSATGIVARTIMAIRSGATTILTDMVDNDLNTLTSELVYQAAVNNDSLAQSIMHETGTLLGIGITSLANIFNPDFVIIGGGVSKAGDMILTPARQEVQKRAMPGIAEHLKILPAMLGEDAGAIGAAGIILYNETAKISD
ncbi:ROK family protein [Candidatus Sumerlaeota bacterium]|nr:ROK family protein [Candidatus Sumerlaeota bacterium]